MNEPSTEQNPPLRPLRVLVTHQEPFPEGAVTEADRWIILKPGDAGYEEAYRDAVDAWRTKAIPMPYAQSDEPPPDIPAI